MDRRLRHPPARPVVAHAPWHTLDPPRRRAVQRLYEDVIPAAERYDVARFGEPGTTTWLAADGDRVLGFANTVDLAASGAVFLRYLGVDPRDQSTGVGTALLEHLADECGRRGARRILLEVELPDGRPADAPEQRRLRFYRRWGARPVTCLTGYCMPDTTRRGHRIPMLLLWRPVTDPAEPRGAELGAVLAELVGTEYARYADPRFLSDLQSSIVC